MSSPAVSAAGVGEFGGGGGRAAAAPPLPLLEGAAPSGKSGPSVSLAMPRKPQHDGVMQLPWHWCGSLALFFCWRNSSCSTCQALRANQAAAEGRRGLGGTGRPP